MTYKALHDLSSVITKGTTPTTLGYEFVESGINFIKIESITTDGAFIEDKFGHITEECHNKLIRSQLEENDILFSIAGAVGRTAIVSRDILPANTNQALAIIRVKQGEIYLPYLLWALKSPYVEKQYHALKQGVAQINLSLKNIGDLLIPVVEYSLQKEIAFRMDRVQKLICKRKAQIKYIDDLVKSQFIEMFGMAHENPKNWCIKKGVSLFKFASGKFLPETRRKEQGVPVYGGNGIAWYTDVPLITHPTIVIGRVGAYCGNIRKVCEPIWVTDNAIYIKDFFTEDINLTYLYALMQQMNFSQYADFSGQPKITQKPLESMEYMLPPLDLQNQFAHFVEQTDKSKIPYETEVAA